MPPESAPYDFLDPPKREGELGRMGPYRILDLLGKGGMGEVFRARDARLNRYVALKFMNSKFAGTPNSRKRFVEEARSMAAVHHDNVATIFEVGIHRSMPFIAMEVLQGQPLNVVMKSRKQFDYQEVLRLAKEVSLGLTAAHHCGIIHRDIKPGNIWIEEPSGRAKILDFGLAIVNVELDGSPRGSAVGSPGYLAPEQARNDPVDERTDLYSLGVVLYQMCAGRLPLHADSIIGQMIANICIVPRPLQQRSPETPLPLCELIHRLLEKEPRNRPQSASHLQDLLDAVAFRCESDNEVALQIVTEKSADSVSKKSSSVRAGESSLPTSPLKAGLRIHNIPRWMVSVAGVVVVLVTLLWWTTRPDRTATQVNTPTNTSRPTSVTVNPESLRPLVLSRATGSDNVIRGEAARFRVQMDNRALAAASDPKTINSAAKVTAQIVTVLQQTGRNQSQRPTFPKKISPTQLPAVGQSKEFEIQFLTSGLLPGSFEVVFELQSPSGQTISRTKRQLIVGENLNDGDLLGFDNLRTHAGRGADTFVRSDAMQDFGGSDVLRALRKGPSEREHIYLRFDLSKLAFPKNEIDRTVLLLTVQGGGFQGVSEFSAYGIVDGLPDDWIETKAGHLTWDKSPCRDGVGGQKFLGSCRLDNNGDHWKDKPDALRLFGRGLDDFLRSAPNDLVTIVLIRQTAADKPNHFKSREGKPTEAPALAIRRTSSSG